jgi:UDP-N-acetyl-D-glucosamine dehydrogenase
MGIDFWEVIEAAKTKPFGFMPFYPGPGVGGHCIPVDPYYLSWKARAYDFYTKFIELAAEVNQAMPYHIVDLVTRGLGRQGRPVLGARILVLGVAFKPDIDDARNSPAERIIELLLDRGAEISYYDPYVPSFTVGGDVFQSEPTTFTSVPLTESALTDNDCVVVVTAHQAVNYDWVVRCAPLVIDSCNATADLHENAPHILRLGAPA